MPADAAAEQQEQDESSERLLKKLEPLLAKGDNASLVALVKEYGHDNADLRARNRELTRDLKAAQGKVKDGDVVLTGDDAKAWQALQKLDVPVKELPAKLGQAAKDAKEVSDYRRDGLAEDLAKEQGWNAKVLKGLVRLNNIALERRTVKGEDGEKTSEVVVLVPGEGDEDPEPMDPAEYVEQHLGDFRDALAGAEAARKERQETPSPSGPRMVRQRSGEGGPGKGVTDQQVEQDVRSRHHFGI